MVLSLLFSIINGVWLHPSFVGLDRSPILGVVGLYGVASIVWLLSIRQATRVDRSKWPILIWAILLFAVGFRLIQLCAPPILERDIYRYLWDGIVTSHGVSPYRYPPAEILSAGVSIEDPVLRRTVAISAQSESHHQILEKVHFPEYTTIYPPLSQFVFAVTMWLVPDRADVKTHLLAMKFVLVLFDVATMVLVWGLLKKARLHVGWLIAYAWNPLVIKEIANSGHLDSIAVCLCTASIYVLFGAPRSRGEPGFWRTSGSATLLAAGTAAKLFPVILAPLMMVYLSHTRARRIAQFGALFALLTVGLCGPQLVTNDVLRSAVGGQQQVRGVDSKQGLTGFLSHWRINEVVFSFVYENARPDRAPQASNRAWFVVTSNEWRTGVWDFVTERDWSSNPPYFVARVVTLTALSLIYAGVLWRTFRRENSITGFLEQAFFVIVAFLALQPTQNPWYWVWAMPLVCFVRNRGWLLVAPILFLYYVRFFCKFSDVEVVFLGRAYRGEGVFDYLLVWLEHSAIWLGVLWFHLQSFCPTNRIAARWAHG